MSGKKGTPGKGIAIKARLRNMLYQRLQSEGWNSIRHFTSGSGVPFSSETVRRAFNETSAGKLIEALTLASIMVRLNYTASEVKSLLQQYTTDQELWPLIGENKLEITEGEKGLLGAYRKLLSVRPEMHDAIMSHLGLLASSSGVELPKVQKR